MGTLRNLKWDYARKGVVPKGEYDSTCPKCVKYVEDITTLVFEGSEHFDMNDRIVAASRLVTHLLESHDDSFVERGRNRVARGPRPKRD